MTCWILPSPLRPIRHCSGSSRYGCYQICLAQAGLVDRGDQDLAIRLQHHLTAGTTPELLHGIRRIVVHDVYHLSLVHYALVSLLIKLVDDGGMLQHFSSGLNTMR